MVARIRLARWGQSHSPFYGVTVHHHQRARDHKPIDTVGTYNPIPDAQGRKHLELNVERIKYWMGCGAQTTRRVAWLLSKANLLPPLPQTLQGVGAMSLKDAKTWDIALRDAKTGEIISVLDPQEARQALGPHLDDQLPASAKRDEPLLGHHEVGQLAASAIRLDGREPAADLSAWERLRVLKRASQIL